MITLKNADQIAKMRRAGHLLDEVLTQVCAAVAPGVTTKQLDHLAEKLIRQAGAKPSFLGYQGFPASLCTSVDSIVVHGFPDNHPLREGSIVGLDCGLILDGWQSDMARTVCVGNVSAQAKRLVEVTKQCFLKGLPFVRSATAWVMSAMQLNGVPMMPAIRSCVPFAAMALAAQCTKIRKSRTLGKPGMASGFGLG